MYPQTLHLSPYYRWVARRGGGPYSDLWERVGVNVTRRRSGPCTGDLVDRTQGVGIVVCLTNKTTVRERLSKGSDSP